MLLYLIFIIFHHTRSTIHLSYLILKHHYLILILLYEYGKILNQLFIVFIKHIFCFKVVLLFFSLVHCFLFFKFSLVNFVNILENNFNEFRRRVYHLIILGLLLRLFLLIILIFNNFLNTIGWIFLLLINLSLRMYFCSFIFNTFWFNIFSILLQNHLILSLFKFNFELFNLFL